MNDWSKDINLETIKEYLQECAENDDYHYEQYQIDIVMHEYIRQKQIIERLNNIIKEIRNQLDYLETYSSREDVFEDMSRRLNNIESIIGSDKE